MQKPISIEGLFGGNAQTFLLLLVTGLAVYICFLMAMPFLPALVWALTLAVLFTPLQIWLETKLKHASLAALISVLIIGNMVIVPALLVGQQLAIQVVSGAQLIETKVASGEWRRVLNTQPRLVPIISTIEQHINLPETGRAQI